MKKQVINLMFFVFVLSSCKRNTVLAYKLNRGSKVSWNVLSLSQNNISPNIVTKVDSLNQTKTYYNIFTIYLFSKKKQIFHKTIIFDSLGVKIEKRTKREFCNYNRPKGVEYNLPKNFKEKTIYYNSMGKRDSLYQEIVLNGDSVVLSKVKLWNEKLCGQKVYYLKGGRKLLHNLRKIIR